VGSAKDRQHHLIEIAARFGIAKLAQRGVLSFRRRLGELNEVAGNRGREVAREPDDADAAAAGRRGNRDDGIFALSP
jgi:hypothetical protein